MNDAGRKAETQVFQEQSEKPVVRPMAFGSFYTALRTASRKYRLKFGALVYPDYKPNLRG